jgi:hypothetical protein
MISKRVYPDRPIVDNNQCIICMDENKPVISHYCSICNKDSWKACNVCMNKLDKCPICRTQFNPVDPVIPINRIIINININDNMVNNIPERTYNNHHERLNLSRIIFKLCILLILGSYLGKIIMFTFCSCVCNNENTCDRYSCNPYIEKSYWKKVFGLESILGMILIIIGKIWVYKIRE